MKKNYKFGFSYIELVFAMAIVVILLAISAPFLTRKNYSQTGKSYGEYRCWAQVDDSGEWHLYENSRYNASKFDYTYGNQVEQCRFIKPIGVNEYDITLVSGGGGGSMAEFPKNFFNDGKPASLMGVNNIFGKEVECDGCTYNEDFIKSYKVVERNYELLFNPGVGGESGKAIRFLAPLKGFDDDNEIKINLCNTEYDKSFNEKKLTNGYCVGKGGDGGTYNKLSSYRAINKTDFYRLLTLYDDLVYSNHAKASDLYFGTGDGSYSFGDEEKHILDDYGISYDEEGFPNENDVKQKLVEFEKKVDDLDPISTGSTGDYTRFIVEGVENQYCSEGHCFMPGGKYGETKKDDSNLKKINVLYDCQDKDVSNGYYCYGTDFGFASVGKYNNSVAENGNQVVIIGNLEQEERHFKNAIQPYEALKDIRVISNSSEENNIQELDIQNRTNFGAGGGGGGFTFRITKMPICKYIKVTYNNGSEKDVFSSSSGKLVLDGGKNPSEIVTCDGSDTSVFNQDSGSKFARTITLKRTDGGRGNGGAIIIRW